jgi:hypothetical protein
MNTKNNILQELSELNSQLAGVQATTPYVVPVGYFEGLAAQIVKSIKAEEAVTAAEEIGHLSPLLAGLTKQNPYTVPVGYFTSIDETVSSITNEETEPSVQKELAAISPLLSGLKKTNPYSIPSSYFEQLNTTSVAVNKPATKVVSMGSRKWWKMAAAAVVIGIIVMAGITLIKGDKVSPSTDSYAWIKKNTKKVATEKIEEFVTLADEENLVEGTIASVPNTKEELKTLIKDVPESEIQSLLNDTQALEDISEETDNSMMN